MQCPHRDPSTSDPPYRSGLRPPGLLRPLLTSAARSRRITPPSVPNPGQYSRSPAIRLTAFNAQPPNLQPAPLMDVGFAIFCPLARCRRPHHPVFVHRLAPLLNASFRPRLATTPLRFAITSPPSGCEEDSHLQAVNHARRTEKRAALTSCPSRLPSLLVFLPPYCSPKLPGRAVHFYWHK